MESLILTAGTPRTLLWGTFGWGTAGLVLTLAVVPLGLAIRNGLRSRRRMPVARLGLIPSGKALRPHAA
jgi:hypothetical protein